MKDEEFVKRLIMMETRITVDMLSLYFSMLYKRHRKVYNNVVKKFAAYDNPSITDVLEYLNSDEFKEMVKTTEAQ